MPLKILRHVFSFVICVSVVCVLYLFYPIYWFKTFFDEMSHTLNENEKAIFFQIWVSPENTKMSKACWIGGSEHREKEWVNSLKTLLHSAKIYKKFSRNIAFEYHLLVDQRTYDHKRSVFLYLENAYPNLFFVDLNYELYSQIDQKNVAALADHCSQGCGALCSDWLRLEYILSNPAHVLIYMDIDTFSQAARDWSSSSADLFGMHKKLDGFYHTFRWNKGMMSFNSDLLISQKTEPQLKEYLRTQMNKKIFQSSSIYHTMLPDQTILSIKSKDSYRLYLSTRQKNALRDSKENFNPLGEIIFGVGPSFYLYHSYWGLMRPYRYGFVENLKNYMSWSLDNMYPCLPICAERLISFYDYNLACVWIDLYLAVYDYILLEKYGLSGLDLKVIADLIYEKKQHLAMIPQTDIHRIEKNLLFCVNRILSDQ